MFEAGDPDPEPFDWGPSRWVTEQAYDEDLARFLGELACDHSVPEAQTRGLASRALNEDRDRLFPKRIATRLIGPDCPPAKVLPDNVRSQLEQLAKQGDTAAAARDVSSADAGE